MATKWAVLRILSLQYFGKEAPFLVGWMLVGWDAIVAGI
jgi:hypothetical protein